MDANELNALADLVAGQLCARGMLPGSDAERQERLRNDLFALSERYSVLNEVVANVRAVIAEHGYLASVDPDSGSGGKPEAEELKPPKPQPHRGHQFGDDADFDYEIKKLLEKLDRLRRPNEDQDYEHKFPWNVQVDIGLLISILIELLDLIRKLMERLRRLERGGGRPDVEP